MSDCECECKECTCEKGKPASVQVAIWIARGMGSLALAGGVAAWLFTGHDIGFIELLVIGAFAGMIWGGDFWDHILP